jgi:hypothetical protein
MRTRLTLAALALSLAVGACNNDSPTTPNTTPNGQQTPPELKKASKLLKNLPVTGTTVADIGGATGTFTGKVSITSFNFRDNGDGTGTLLVSGSLQDANEVVVSRFTDVEATLTSNGSPTAAMACSILNLDIGAIHLDLLGLVVDLAPIHLDITGQTGSGQLLGNLLCGLAGLLDGFPLLSTLQQILDIIAQINALLG